MKIRGLICVLTLAVSATVAVAQTDGFQEARRVGQTTWRRFFVFSTATSKYVIRHDGMGEVDGNGDVGRFFHLKLGMNGRVERVYFREYQGDMLIMYEVSDGRSAIAFVTRLNPQTRKQRWVTPININGFGACVVEGDAVSCGESDHSTKIDLKTGAVIKKTSSAPAREQSSSSTSPTRE
ncbi:MAG TPA: hypothetical protein VFZ22_07385 [Pyrinomonadaceae bacterium]|nr:hypothetical protein [Pyrinomonadaceae bacterium]